MADNVTAATSASHAESLASDESEVRRIAGASFVGTALEWYDYFLYGTAAALVFNRLFFPDLDPVIGTIASFVTFAVGFVARPLGAVFFGHLGDTHGRKRALIATVVLMGLATGLIGMLPTYETIGIAAPLLLATLRFVQGFSVGGEWSGAVLLAIEHAPPRKRVMYASIPQLGSPAGTLLSSGAFAAVGLLPDEEFYSWGWRVPFLAAFLLLLVGLYMRLRVEESPLFTRVLAENRLERLPLLAAVRDGWLRMLVAVGAAFLGIGGFFLLTTFMINYGTAELGMSKSLMLNATLLGAVAEVAVIVVFGRLANRVGAWWVCTAGGAASLLLAFPVFWLVDTREPVLVVLGVMLGIAVISVPYAPIGALIAELFPDESRYSAVALSYNISGAISGFVPLIAVAWLQASGGASWSSALLLALIAAVTLAGSVAAGRMVGQRKYV